MSTISARTQALIDEFGRSANVTPTQLANLREAIEGSPILAQRIEQAATENHLLKFALLPAEVNAGGTYNGATKTISLPARILESRQPGSPRDLAELTFVLGHEIEHGFNYAETKEAYRAFRNQLTATARSDRDFTGPIETMLEKNRKDESKANIGGWNALAGRIREQNPDATLDDMFAASSRSRDFVELNISEGRIVARSNIRVGEDLAIDGTPSNIQGMAENYFDKPAETARLGHRQSSDYPNYYGAYLVSQAIEYDQRHHAPGGRGTMTINMQQIGLQERILEENGISLSRRQSTPYAYMDSSSAPPALSHFDHTESAHTYVPIAAEVTQSELDRSLEHSDQQNCRRIIEDLDVKSHELHQQIREKIASLDAEHGRSFDASSERLSASLLVLARENGLDRVDHVVLSQQTSTAPAAHGIFVVKGELDDPAALRASTATAAAAQCSVQESMERLAQVNQREAEGASQDRVREQAQEQQRGALAR